MGPLSSLFDQLPALFGPAALLIAGRAMMVVIAGLLLGRLMGALSHRWVGRVSSPERATLARRMVTWGVVIMAFATALQELGFDLTVLLGAAGVLTVAVGFASQTSASNVISGLFLIGERPFSVGDSVMIGGTEGEVLSIDLLSTKIRTWDNRYVRVPNETVMKAEITNMSRFAIRRLDLFFSVGHHADLPTVKRLLLGVAAANPNVLDEPVPVVWVVGIGPDGTQLKFSSWGIREGFFELRDKVFSEVVRVLQEEGVDFGTQRVMVEQRSDGQG